MLYLLPTLRIEAVRFNSRYKNDPGEILIGGDRCDVYAKSADVCLGVDDPNNDVRVGLMLDVTVELSDVAILTTDLEAHTLAQEMYGNQAEAKKERLIEYLTDLALDTIRNSHDSIGYETFVPQKKVQRITMPSGTVNLA
jgi:hypothetical protein